MADGIRLFLVMAESDILWSNYSSNPPLSLISLGSYVINKNILPKQDIFICDLNIEAGKKYYEANINKINGDKLIVGFSVNLFNIENTLKLARRVKILYPDSIIILGGPYITTYIEKYNRFEEIPGYVDFIVSKYGEDALLNIIKIVNNSSNHIERKIEGSDAPLDNKLDYSLVNYLNSYSKNRESVPYFETDNYYQISYISSFGCVHRTAQYAEEKWCGFCSLWDKGVKERNLEIIKEEVITALDALRINKNDEFGLLLRDISDAPSANVARGLKEKIQDKYPGATIKILAYQRADNVTDNQIGPFDIIFIGTESGSNDILNECNKGLNISQIDEAFNLIRSQNKKIITSFILGLKGESANTINETKQLINKCLDKELFLSAGVNIFTPFPGSPFFNLLRNEIGDANSTVSNINDLKRLRKEWIKYFTDISFYELNIKKKEIESLIKTKIGSDKYFDFGLQKKITYSKDIPRQFHDILDLYGSHIVSISEDMEITGAWWGTISIREPLFKKIYGIESGIINVNFYIDNNNIDYDRKYNEFNKLNNLCFSDVNSILNTEILKNGKPTVSDILPKLDKSLIFLKNPSTEWERVARLFDYREIINNGLDEGASINKDYIMNNYKYSEYGNIKRIIKDYLSTQYKADYKEEEIDDAFRLIFYMYELHLVKLRYDIFIYYPIKTTRNGSVAFTLGLRYGNFGSVAHFEDFIVSYLRLLNKTVIQRLFNDLHEENMRNSRRSAIAAIMSRNMAHNIDSHVTPRATVEEVRKRLIELELNYDEKITLDIIQVLKGRLDEYRQKRADFLAQITSEPIMTTKTALFCHDIIIPLVENVLMMDNIARNESVCYKNAMENRLKIKLLIDGEEKKCEFSCYPSEKESGSSYIYPDPDGYPYSSHCKNCTFCRDSENHIANPGLLTGFPNHPDQTIDLEVELPGPVGEHAFYGFLENVIRNSAKHNRDILDSKKDENLIITIQIKDPDNEQEKLHYYQVEIWDNITDPNKDINEKKLNNIISEYIQSDLIDETGKKIDKAFGIAEMKIAAALLAGYSEYSVDKKALEVSVEGRNSGSETKERLIYRFKLMKAKKVCAVIPEWNNDVEKLKSKGIWIFKSIDDLKKDYIEAGNYGVGAAFKFAVLDLSNLKGNINENNTKDTLDKLDKIILFMPYRIIILVNDEWSNSLIERLPKGAVILQKDENIFPERESDILNWVWNKWLSRWDNRKNIDLHIYLDQEREHDPTKTWIEKASEFNRIPVNYRTNVFAKTNNSYSNHDKSVHLLFDRHAGALDKIDPNGEIDIMGDHSYIFLDKLNKDFSKIFFPSFNTDPWLLPFELIESGLFRVLVIDERLAEFCLEIIEDTEANKLGYRLTKLENKTPMLWHIAFAAKIFICTHFGFNEEPKPLHYSSYSKCENDNNKIQLPMLAVKKLNNDITYNYKLKKNGEVQKLGNIDMMIIHQGILDEWVKGQNVERFLKTVRKKIPFVVIDSGRGIPSLPSGCKFVPYSILADLISGKRIAKYTLTQILLGLTRFEKALNDWS